MSVAAKSIYARTLEGNDLEASLPSLGAGRHVVRSVRTVDGVTGSTVNIVPGSSRLTQLGPRLPFKEMLEWHRAEMLGRIHSGKDFAFLHRFAQAIDFAELPANVVPTGLSLALGMPSFAGLDWDFVSKTGTVREARTRPKVMRDLFDRMKLRLGLPTALLETGGKLVANYPPPIGPVFVTENKKSYSIENAFLRRLRFMDPETQKPRSLISALNEERSFLVTFSDINYAYVNAQLVRSAHVRQSLDVILRVVEVHNELAGATSKKGKLRGAVDPASLFGVIEDSCAKKDTLLLLDDGSTEWTDYIGIAARSAGPVLSFCIRCMVHVSLT